MKAKEFKLTLCGKDDWERCVYKDQNGKLWKNTNIFFGEPELCSVYENDFYGEPYIPMKVLYPDSKVIFLK